MKQQNSITIPIIKFKQVVIKKRKILLILALMLPILGFILKPHKSGIALNLFLLAFFVIIGINVLYYIFVKRYFIIGNICFSQYFIKIRSEILKFNEIKCISINFGSYKGDTYPFAEFGIGIFGLTDGADNSIIITKTDETKIKFNILIESKNKLKIFKKILILYKNNGVNVKL